MRRDLKDLVDAARPAIMQWQNKHIQAKESVPLERDIATYFESKNLGVEYRVQEQEQRMYDEALIESDAIMRGARTTRLPSSRYGI